MKFYTEAELIQAGRNPNDLPERPVAFAVIRALDQNRQSCYLFETNEKWRRLNLIGGKQEAIDGGDYSQTIRRELNEELAVTQPSLTRLNYQPIVGYAVSGTTGELSRYPCVFFGVVIEGPLGSRLRQGDQWLTEEEIIEEYRKAGDYSPLMVNPVYLSYLLDGEPSRLSRVPLSTWERVVLDPDDTYRIP